jgi:hypothetical protein
MKRLDTKQIPEREKKRPKPVKSVNFELIFFINRDKPFKKRKSKCHRGESKPWLLNEKRPDYTEMEPAHT